MSDDPADLPALDVLLPTGRGRLEPRSDEAELLDLLDEGAPPRMRGSMIATLDGAATGPDRVTGSINGPADLRVFQALRAIADAVVVGAGTVRLERYGPIDLPAPLAAARAARGRTEHVPLVVVTASGRVPGAVLGAERPPIVVTVPGAPGLDELRDRLGRDGVVVAGGADGVDLPAALDALAERGLRHLVTEGGPTLLAALAAAGRLDELCLTWSPTVVGGAAPRVLDTPEFLPAPLRGELVHLLHADGVLLGRWRLDGTSVQ